MDISLQQLVMLLALVLSFAGCGWALHVMRERGISPWKAIAHYVAVKIMESGEPGREQVRPGAGDGFAGSGMVVLGQQNHAEPANTEQTEPRLRQLSKEELIVLLAVQRNEGGGYRYSANHITAFVGGAAASVKTIIAEVRGKKETPPASPTLHRPVNGW